MCIRDSGNSEIALVFASGLVNLSLKQDKNTRQETGRKLQETLAKHPEISDELWEWLNQIPEEAEYIRRMLAQLDAEKQ